MEGENPTRKYKWFRPRQAVRGSIPLVNSVNFATAGLYNDSNGAQYLAVRLPVVAGNHPVLASYQKGLLAGATLVTNVTPLIPESAKLPGQLFSVDFATLFTNTDWDVNQNDNILYLWPFPFAVLPPNYSLVLQNQTASGQITAAMFVWEAIYPDELDYAFEL